MENDRRRKLSKHRPNVRLVVPPIAGAGDARVELDGEDVTKGIKGLQLIASRDRETVLILHYACDVTEVEGEMRVKHLCGLGHDVEGEKE